MDEDLTFVEPSDAEKATWTDVTFTYVLNLELAITRLHAEITQRDNTIDGLEFLNAENLRLSTEVLDVAISDKLDEAGSPLSWKERAIAAEAEIERLKSDVSDLVRAGSDEATENERLREALRPFAALGATYFTERQRIHAPDDVPTQPTVFLVGEVRAAFCALADDT